MPVGGFVTCGTRWLILTLLAPRNILADTVAFSDPSRPIITGILACLLLVVLPAALDLGLAGRRPGYSSGTTTQDAV